jgi:putative membrane protein
MTEPNDKPQPGSKSDTASSIKEAVGGAAGVAMAATAITRDRFTTHAAIANLYELEAARIALRRAQRHDVKEFARAMIADHEKMGSELKSFLGGTNSPQKPPEQLDTLHQTLIDDLNGAANEDFDKRYIAQQRKAHQEAITLFRTYYNTGRDDGLRNLAHLALPVLDKHLEMVRELEQAS